MCGIAGHIGLEPLPDDRIQRTLESMRRRGPDAQNVFRERRNDGRFVDLLHARLTIIDLDTRANQPFVRDDLVVVFNGEIYNYLELRSELAGRGHRFTTTSDTEVLAAALREWTVDEALDRLEGMWAFAAFDRRDGTVLLSRDRFGEKPLHTYEDDCGLYFASEVKFLTSMVGRRFPVNVRHVQRYLVNGYKALYKAGETFFHGVGEVSPATIVELRSGESKPGRRSYWSPEFTQDPGMTFEQAASAVREELLRAVEIRLRADVPLAFCMSGGIDSNVLISIAKNVCGFDVHGFTIENTDARYEEATLVRRAVEAQGLAHTMVSTRAPAGIDGLRELIRQHDAPVYTISYYVHWLLMEAMHDAGYKISLSGTAADELFSGYYDHHLAYLQVTNGSPEAVAHEAAWRAHVQPMVRNPYLSNPRYFIEDPTRREHIFLDRDVFAQFLVEPFDEPFAEQPFTPDLLRNRMANELFAEAVPVILHEDDLNAMYFSIENRSPFLDRRLFELTSRIPTKHLMRDGRAKAVLREAMRGIVPDFILDERKKVGFNAPLADVVDLSSPAVREQLLSTSPIFDVVRRDKIEELLGAADRLANSRSKFLFYFLCARLFLEEHGT